MGVAANRRVFIPNVFLWMCAITHVILTYRWIDFWEGGYATGDYLAGLSESTKFRLMAQHHGQGPGFMGRQTVGPLTRSAGIVWTPQSLTDAMYNVGCLENLVSPALTTCGANPTGYDAKGLITVAPGTCNPRGLQAVAPFNLGHCNAWYNKRRLASLGEQYNWQDMFDLLDATITVGDAWKVYSSGVIRNNDNLLTLSFPGPIFTSFMTYLAAFPASVLTFVYTFYAFWFATLGGHKKSRVVEAHFMFLVIVFIFNTINMGFACRSLEWSRKFSKGTISSFAATEYGMMVMSILTWCFTLIQLVLTVLDKRSSSTKDVGNRQ
eukprot:tig00000057_g50.t1